MFFFNVSKVVFIFLQLTWGYDDYDNLGDMLNALDTNFEFLSGVSMTDKALQFYLDNVSLEKYQTHFVPIQTLDLLYLSVK